MKINNRSIGISKEPYIIAEMSNNHNGSWKRACELLNIAKKAGVDAVKIQTYTAESLTINCDKSDFVIFDKLWRGKTYYDLYNEISMPLDWNKKLFNYAEKIGITIFSSPFDEESIDLLESLNTPAYKIASFESKDWDFIKIIAKTKKPIILSTGLSTMSEVSDTVKYIEKLDRHYISDKKLALLQCTSSYPTPNEDANLYAISELRKEFNLPVGYSDHTEGSDAIEIAISLGATIIEKHFTDTRLDKNFRDHKVSLSLDEVNIFLEKAKKIKTILGRSEKFLTNSELEAGHHISFRRSIYALSDIDIGSLLTEKNLTYLRPDIGISAMNYEKLLGKTAIKDIKKGCLISEKDFQ